MSDFEVEEIIGRKVFSGKVLYLTKWKGFHYNDATWESVKVLKNYRHLIRQYNEKNRHDFDEEDIDSEFIKQPEDSQEVPVKRDEPEQKKEIFKVEHQSQPEIRSIPQLIKDLSGDIKKLYPSPKKKKKRGRPLKLGVSQQEWTISGNRNSKKISQSQKKSPVAHKKTPQKVQSVLRKDAVVERKSKRITVSKETNESNIQKGKKQLQRIYFLQTKVDGVEYVIQENDGLLRKSNTKQMLKLYPQLLVKFLEQSLLKKQSKVCL